MTELPPWKLDEVDPARMKTLALLLADPNPIHFDRAAARRLAGTDQVVNQGPSTMALGVNMLLAAFPGARLVSYRVRLLGLVLAGDGVEGGGTVIDHDILDRQERVRCQLRLDVPGRGRVLEGEAVLMLPTADLGERCHGRTGHPSDRGHDARGSARSPGRRAR